MTPTTTLPWPRMLLGLAGVGVVSAGVAFVPDRAAWLYVVAGAAIAGWLVGLLIPFAANIQRLQGDHRIVGGIQTAAYVVAAIGGALAAPATNGWTLAPMIVALLTTTASPDRAFGPLLALGGATVVAACLGAVAAELSVSATVSTLCAIPIAMLIGISRRQQQQNERQANLLREQQSRARDEARRVALARDLHDVLAHSLGGLVIQLDAVGALLDGGDTRAAADRVEAARGLAVAGLGDARRAVAALRDGTETPVGHDVTVPAAELDRSLDDLLAAHRSVGGQVTRVDAGHPQPVSGAVADVLRRTIQESLSNARKHAPGSPVGIHLDWRPEEIVATIRNQLPDNSTRAEPAVIATGGHGLIGMRERHAALGNGSSVTAGAHDGEFRVRAELRTTDQEGR